jgi:aerobic-type carbon monoxide dehydrogenase small subunit (CoxS/CutS family)
METKTINLTLVVGNEEFPIQTSRSQYHSLMTLLSDRFNLADFGLCSGMGSCGTCNVEVDGEMVLACEMAVNDSLANTRIVVDKQLISVY